MTPRHIFKHITCSGSALYALTTDGAVYEWTTANVGTPELPEWKMRWVRLENQE